MWKRTAKLEEVCLGAVSPHLCRLEKESEMMVPAVEARDLNHWTTGEVPVVPGL